MNNLQFLQTVRKSFIKFLETHPRSNKKLIILHGAITTKTKYKRYYLDQTRNVPMQISDNISGTFGNAMVLNDYEIFIKKIVHYLKSI